MPIPIISFATQTSRRGAALSLALALFALALLPTPSAGGDWPRFRGPNGAGASDAAGLPIEFGPDKNVVWKTKVPIGKSSPVIVGSRIFLTAHDGDQRLVLCLDRDSGRELWRRSITAPRTEHRNKLNDAAAPTAVSDGTNVYALFYDFGLVS